MNYHRKIQRATTNSKFRRRSFAFGEADGIREDRGKKKRAIVLKTIDGYEQDYESSFLDDGSAEP